MRTEMDGKDQPSHLSMCLITRQQTRHRSLDQLKQQKTLHQILFSFPVKKAIPIYAQHPTQPKHSEKTYAFINLIISDR